MSSRVLAALRNLGFACCEPQRLAQFADGLGSKVSELFR